MASRGWSAPGVLVLLLLTSCGVRPTGAVVAGPAPAIPSPSAEQVLPDEPTPRRSAAPEVRNLSVFLLHAGRLAPADRSYLLTNQRIYFTDHPDKLVEVAVQQMVVGPTPEEIVEGWSPAFPSPPWLIPVTVLDVGSNVRLEMPVSVETLSTTAMLQLSCTVTKALESAAPQTVTSVSLRNGQQPFTRLPPCPRPLLTVAPGP